MKTMPLAAGFLVFLLALLLLPCTSVRAQTNDSKQFHQAIDQAFEKGNLMVAISTVEWRPGLSMAATKIATGKTITLELALSRHESYSFIATSISENTDIDLYLRDSLGNVLASDKEPDNTPIIEFQVPKTGNYRLQLHVPASDKAVNYVSLSLLQSGGHSTLEAEYRDVSDRFFSAATAVENSHPDISWSSSNQQWSILGYSLVSEQGLTLNNLRFNTSRYYLAATASPKFEHLALYLANSKQQIIDSSPKGSSFPLLDFNASDKERYDLRVSTGAYHSPGFVFVGIFEH